MVRGLLHFPSGTPGAALLLLRTVLASLLIVEAYATLTSRLPAADGMAAGVVAVALGACALLGGFGLFNMPAHLGITAVLLVRIVHDVWTAGLIPLPSETAGAILKASVAVSLVLAGPGAYSIDAYRFGRREIRIPPPTSHGGLRGSRGGTLMLSVSVLRDIPFRVITMCRERRMRWGIGARTVRHSITSTDRVSDRVAKGRADV